MNNHWTNSVGSRTTRRLCLLAFLCSSGITIEGCKARSTGDKLEIGLTDDFPPEALQWETIRIRLELQNARGNPFDPKDVDVRLQLTCPDGSTLTHPAFFTTDYQIVFDHGKEVARDTGRKHWEIRWTPIQSGIFHWSIIAESNSRSARIDGDLNCKPQDRPGFVRVSRLDPHYFEFSDGSFFYPLGHVTRSPVDSRWRDNGPENLNRARECTDQKTFAYDRWFEQMQRNNENFCAVWMAPWWLGLEWSPTLPGYNGLGDYNQIHAAQLDRIFDSAERHGIYVLLFVMNHGQLSTVIDAEWEANPYRKDESGGGLVATAYDFFKDPESKRLHTNKLRYILARWGSSPALFAISLSSETDSFEPYHGCRCDHMVEVIDSSSCPYYWIPAKREMVNEWLIETSRFIRENDAHGHLVTTQFSMHESGHDLWPLPEFDFALNNCYERAFHKLWPLVERGAGIAEALFGWSRKHHVHSKPKLVAEWGGSHLQNSHGKLAADLHTGIWSLAMTDCAGCTGYWWWNEIDSENLYSHYAALSRFLGDYDRRGKDLKSAQGAVSLEIPRGAIAERAQPEPEPVFITHPSRSALTLSGDTGAFAYIYHQAMNLTRAFGMDDIRFDLARNTYLSVPTNLRGGGYRVEFWDTFEGKIIESHDERVREAGDEPRRILILPFRAEIALKMTRVSD